MDIKRKVTAIILAGGQGSRFENSIPKQFLKIAGKTVLEHTIETFDRHQQVNSIVLVLDVSYHEEWSQRLESLDLNTQITLSASGQTRNLSTKLAIEKCGNPDFVLVHDAVRPMLQSSIITECIEQLEDFDAVDVALPSSDTIIEVDAGKTITNIPDRNNYMLGQTPQGFRFDVIKAAYKRFDEISDRDMTDDCAVVSKYCPESQIKVVIGSTSNIKITRPLDFYIVDALFKLRVADSRDLSVGSTPKHLQDKVAVVVGGSSGIGLAISDLLSSSGAISISLSRSSTGTDVKVKDQLDKAFRAIADEKGKIDFVVMAAGVMHSAPAIHQNEREVNDILDTNLMGVINVAKSCYPHLKSSRGQLLIIGSSSWSRGRANQAVYSASKAAAVNFAQAIAEEWHHDGIRVNVLNPGRTKTQLRAQSFRDEPPNTLLDPKEVAEECLKILNVEASGQIFQLEPKS